LNILILCRGCILHPQALIHPPWSSMDCDTQVCGVWIIEQSLSLINLSTGAYPVEYTSPANPGSQPPYLERNCSAMAGELKCLLARKIPRDPDSLLPQFLRQSKFQGSMTLI
jgi:hypothetical protein